MNITLDKLKEKKSLNKESILSLINQKDIIEYYLKDRINFCGAISSPFREDRHPSFSFKVYDNGTVLWQDWSNGERGDAFKFVMKLFNCNFAEALKIIDRDLNLNLTNGDLTMAEKMLLAGAYKEKPISLYVKPKANLFVIPQGFTKADYKYWKQFGISIETLIKYDVVSAQYVYLDNKHILSYSRSKPMFAYYFNKQHRGTVKIYSPWASKEKKFLFNGTNRDLDGINQLPHQCNLIIITKSRKDVMLFHELGYYAISPQSESYGINLQVIDDLKRISSNLCIWYDNDETGRKESEFIQSEFGLRYLFTPNSQKDVSDYCKVHGKEQTKEMVERKLNDLCSQKQ